ncbi:DEAD/DEAH box helicase [Mesorhizobium caraganae]|uniref:DEAD/DEAH box helicase n=1 Tax=Mesorhizobium caraganae TaxID=483206 RepID=UPI0033350157
MIQPEQELPSDEVLRGMMPDAYPLFFAGRMPWPAQRLVMPPVVKGRSTLLAAPTASGKTEAAIAPLYQRHISFRRPHLSTLYIAPTKALANDIFERLDNYLGVRSPGCVTRYTGDRHEFQNAEGLFCLIVTPEALDSLQLTRPAELASVRAVVIDEIHLLHGAPRGQQLRFVLDRVRAAAIRPRHPDDTFHIVGMTATIDRLEEVRDIWLGSEGTLVRHGAAREIALELLDIDLVAEPGDDIAAKSARALARWLKRSGTPKVLVFDNTRNGAHALAAALDGELRAAFGAAEPPPLHLHMGVLSATERERVETAMKTERKGVCVATSTLEIGIDIGDVDAIVLATPPRDVGSYLQRIGRGNRRSGTCHVLALHAGAEGAAMQNALLDCAQRGDLDDVHEYDRPSVRFQQVLSHAWHATRNEDGLEPKELVRRTGGHDHADIVADMVSTGALNRRRGIVFPNDALIEEGDERRIHSVIMGGSGLPVLDARTGEAMTQVSDRGQAGGRMFVGGGFRKLNDAREGPMHLESHSADRNARLALLPKTRGARGLSRPVVWALARQRGLDPQSWTWRGGRWSTYGGGAFNSLLAAVLAHRFAPDIWRADDFGVDGPDPGALRPPPLTLAEMLEATHAAAADKNALTVVAKKSVQPSRYRSRLSPGLQSVEAKASIPLPAFVRWLTACRF